MMSYKDMPYCSDAEQCNNKVCDGRLIDKDIQAAKNVSTAETDNAGSEHCDGYLSTTQAVWDAMLAAAPEAKP